MIDCGILVRKDGKFKPLTGNQIGVIMLEYILSQMKEKNILKDNKFAMKKLLGGEVHIRLYFYSSDDGEFLYSSFVDDELFFSDSSLNHKICYSKDDERFQETQNPKTNKKLNIDKHKKIIFPIGSDNITNSKTEFYGFMEYDFGNISISEEEFLNNEFMQKNNKIIGYCNY